MASSFRLPTRLARRARREADPDATPATATTAASWMRAARVLEVRSRRETSGPFTGSYRSAFRGGGVEFEESRPYVPGDDVRTIDWNVLARTGVPFVKRFREERDQAALLVLDVSGSMRFGSGPAAGPGGGGVKAMAAAHAGALVAAAAARAGDRVGLVTFDEDVREVVPAARGEAHARAVVHKLVEAPARAAGGTGLGRALAFLRRRMWRPGLVVLLSDFRDERFFEPGLPGRPPPRADLVALTRVHDVVAVVIRDPREEAIPAVGSVRVVDPEHPGRTRVLRSGRRARERYRAAAEVRQRALLWRLRSDGCEVMSLRTDRDPLRAWLRLFARRAGTRGVSREGR